MRKTTLITLTLMALVLFPTNLFADALKKDWYGVWAMNHDGLAGTLRIADTKVDCISPAWCDMAISYVNDKGVRHTGRIEKIDSKWQHMVFNINFSGNRQRFDAYIFSWDKLKMAGTTSWQSRIFGFYATK